MLAFTISEILMIQIFDPQKVGQRQSRMTISESTYATFCYFLSSLRYNLCSRSNRKTETQTDTQTNRQMDKAIAIDEITDLPKMLPKVSKINKNSYLMV